jgi:diguanylate cyclase (GGDEF)-like protein
MSAQKAYHGRILNREYSQELQERIRDCLASFQAYDNSGSPVIPYIAAWRENSQDIWYEFVGQGFCRLLGCSENELVEAFKDSFIDRRVYHYQDVETKIQEEVLGAQELQDYRRGLREEGKKTGTVEAVYKLVAKNEKIVWLKDQASIETYEADRICISLGCLTDVTKEMEQKTLLEQIGYFDALTNLPNRNIMNRILEINISQVQRQSISDFIFLMFDIDHFKKVNDTYGHQAGDYVLATLAEVMMATKRKGDEIGRYGGEEFFGLTHGNIQSGREFAERLRRKVEETPFIYKGEKIAVTVSIGLVSATQLDTLDADNLISTADKRLYRAKQQGRNRVVAEDKSAA